MSWPSVTSVIRAQWDAFQAPGVIASLIDPTPMNSQAMRALIVRLEKESSDTLDEACRTFAGTLRWPALQSWQQLILFHRLQQSLDLLRFFDTGERQQGLIVPDYDEDIPESEVLEFLLIYYWSHIGRARYLYEQTHHL